MSPRLARTAPIALVLTALLLLSGCVGTSKKDETPAAGSSGGPVATSIKVGSLRGQPHFYAPWLYQKFAPAGTTFEVVTLDTAPALNDALISGSIDFAVGSITSTVSSDASGRDLKIIAAAADGGTGCVGNDSVKTIKDLPGKKVGYLAASSPLVVMNLLLQKEGIDPKTLNLVKLAPQEMANAYTSGAIDAFCGPEIGITLAKKAGAHDIADPYSTAIGKLNIGLITTGAKITADPATVQAVVETHAKATAYMSGNQAEWLPEMVKNFGGDQATFTTALKNFWLHSDMPAAYKTQITALADNMTKLGLTTTTPTIDTLVDSSFIYKVPAS